MLKIVGYVLLCFLLLVFFFLILPLRVRVRHDGVIQLWCGFGPINLKLLPAKKRGDTEIKKEKRKKQSAKSQKNKPKSSKRKLSFETVIAYIRLALNAVSAMTRPIFVSNLLLHLKIGGEDAAKTAMTYGTVSAGVSSLYPVLQKSLRIKKTDISVDADFSAQKTEILADVTISACPLRILFAALRIGIAFLKIYMKQKKQQPKYKMKGGNLHEQHQ